MHVKYCTEPTVELDFNLLHCQLFCSLALLVTLKCLTLIYNTVTTVPTIALVITFHLSLIVKAFIIEIC